VRLALAIACVLLSGCFGRRARQEAEERRELLAEMRRERVRQTSRDRREAEAARVEQANPYGACIMRAQLDRDWCVDGQSVFSDGSQCNGQFAIAVLGCRSAYPTSSPEAPR
jgi:hypothetical protein